jgi:HPr kinase/phosphorylase
VELRRISNQLIGSAPEIIRHYIELRGIGVIDVRQLFGMRAIKEESQLDLVVHFEQWDQNKFYDRLGIEDHYTELLDVKVPIVTIPVRPGRNLAAIVEVAAMNNRHRRYGFNAAQELVRKVDQRADGRI